MVHQRIIQPDEDDSALLGDKEKESESNICSSSCPVINTVIKQSHQFKEYQISKPVLSSIRLLQPLGGAALPLSSRLLSVVRAHLRESGRQAHMCECVLINDGSEY